MTPTRFAGTIGSLSRIGGTPWARDCALCSTASGTELPVKKSGLQLRIIPIYYHILLKKSLSKTLGEAGPTPYAAVKACFH